MSSRSPRSTSRTFHVESLGCAKNQVDSELLISALERAGWTLAPGAEDAEVLVVNTCGFISQARKESIETTLELKAQHPDRKVIMVGCLSERYGEELRRELPEIDGFLGNRDPARIVELVEGRSGAAAAAARAPEPARAYERTHLLSFPGSAYVKIAEGCANRCTYCAIPLIRGDLASRARPQILEEIRGLRDRGARELVLIAQDLGSFGTDRGGDRGAERGGELGLLLREISSLPGDFWIRLLYIHPDHFPFEMLPLFEADPRFLPYFDLPFQHASPGILRAMGRKSDPEANLALLETIRARLPGAVIRSTFLVGFPGEREEDVARLLDFQQRARLDWLGAFTYSREEDTPAYSMKGRVSKKIAEERKTEVERRQIPITDRALDAQVGRTLEVLVEERVEGEAMSIGRSYLQAPDVDGLVVVQAALAPGTMARVRITRRNGVDLEGEVVER
jgi:ribosomal protein S12 methylthiotransferase